MDALKIPRFMFRARLVIVILAVGLLWGAAPGATLELHLSPGDRPQARPYPVRAGIPLAPGALLDERNVRLLIDGTEAELQTEVLARYNDKSIKWLLLDFVAKPAAKLTLEFGKGVRPKPIARRIKVTQAAAEITVDTGCLKATIRKSGDGFPDEIFLDIDGDGTYADDERLTAATGVRTNWMDFVHTPSIESHGVLEASAVRGQLDRSRVQITELKAEVTGPLHAVVKVAGNYRYRKVGTTAGYPYAHPQYRDTRPADVGRIPFTVRLHFHRDAATIDLQHTFIYEGDPDRDFANQLALAAPIPVSGDTVVTIGKDDGAAEIPAGASGVVGLSQSSADHFSIWKSSSGGGAGAIVTQGRRAGGWVDVSNSRWGVTAAVWRAWQNYPKAIHAKLSARQVRVFLWPAEAPLMSLRRYTRGWGVSETGARGGVDSFALSRHASRGVAKTHRVLFDFHAGRRKAKDVEPRISWFLQRAYAWPSLDYMCRYYGRTGVAVSPRQPGKYDHLEQAIDGCLDWILFSQERFRWYGMFNYGDIQQCFQNVHPHGRWESDYGRWGWFNGDASGHKPFEALLRHFIRTGRRDIFDQFQAEILHIIDVDMVNSAEYPWNNEGFRDMRGCTHRHNAQHWACFFVGSRGIRAASFSQLYYLTGDERLRDVLDIIAEAAYQEVVAKTGGRTGHSGGRDVHRRMFYALERTGQAKWRDPIAAKWSWLLDHNRGVPAPGAQQAEDTKWARDPAERALTQRKDWRYPGTVLAGLVGGIRFVENPEDRARYRKALDEAVEFMLARYRGGPQGLPREQWPGPTAGPSQGNWNAIPNLMPWAIHALKIHDESMKEQNR